MLAMEKSTYRSGPEFLEVPLYPRARVQVVEHYRRSEMSNSEAGMPEQRIGSNSENGGASGGGTSIPGRSFRRSLI